MSDRGWDWGDDDPDDEDDHRRNFYRGIEVTLPSGATFLVANEGEKEYIEFSTSEYLDAFDFSSISDLRELDAIVRSEMLLWRWDQWILWRRDYDGNVIDEQKYMQ